MARGIESSAKRPRISLDVQPELRHRLRLAAARRDLTVGQYMLEAIQDRLREDLGDRQRQDHRSRRQVGRVSWSVGFTNERGQAKA